MSLYHELRIFALNIEKMLIYIMIFDYANLTGDIFVHLNGLGSFLK